MGGKANNQEVAVPLRQNRELEIADSYLRRVVRGCVLEVVFLVDKRWQLQDSFKPKRFARSAETCTRSISGKGRLNTRILCTELTYTGCRNILDLITITLALS